MLLDAFRPYISAFVTIFVAIDIMDKVPLFLSLTDKFSFKQKKKLIINSLFYSLILTIGFIFIGQYLLGIIGITVSDFKISGGFFLLILSINILISKRVHFFYKESRVADMGIFPLGVPLIARPSLFIVSLICFQRLGTVVVLTMLILNFVFSWLVLDKFQLIIKFIGIRGIKTFSKILNILLAAFAIMIIRQGLIETFY